MLQGTCAGKVPVGAAAGLAASGRLIESTAVIRCSGKDTRTSAAGNTFLGIHPLAVLQEHPHLAGVGTLQPAWRRIAQLFAPLCHQVCFQHP